MKRKHTKYLDSSRDSKKKATFRLKKEIEKYSHILGGKFFTNDYIPEQGISWADIYFLSKKHKNVFYNVTLVTLRTKTMDAISDMAFDRAERLCDIFLDITEEDTQEIKSFYGGISRYEWIDKEVEKIIDNEEYPSAIEEIKFHTDYAYGVGLTVYIDETSLTIDNINRFIDAFIQNGEINFFDAVEKKFPKDELKNCPLDTVNSIVFEPEDWGNIW